MARGPWSSSCSTRPRWRCCRQRCGHERRHEGARRRAGRLANPSGYDRMLAHPKALVISDERGRRDSCREWSRVMIYQERKTNWSGHAQRLADVALEIISQCDRLDTTKGARDPKVIALALLSRSLGHLKATCRLLEIGLITEARTLTRSIRESLYARGSRRRGGTISSGRWSMTQQRAGNREVVGSWVGWMNKKRSPPMRRACARLWRN